MKIHPQLLSDDELLVALTACVEQSNAVTADLLAHLAEVDARKLYLQRACASMFTYCTERLHLSEGAAYKRIAAARAARSYPVILEMLAAGDIHLSAVNALAPHLTEDNHGVVLARAKHRSKRQIEQWVAELAPKPDVPSSMRKLPSGLPSQVAPASDGQGAQGELAAPAPRAPSGRSSELAPLAPERYKVSFTADHELAEDLRRAQDLLRHQVPDGDLAKVVKRAVRQLVESLERRKLGARKRRATKSEQESGDVERGGPASPRPPRAGSRHVPNAVKREVVARDGLCCTYKDRHGRRCSETGRLEFHHLHPWGMAGATTVENVTLRCAAHNAMAAEMDYGRDFMDRQRRKPNKETQDPVAAPGGSEGVELSVPEGARSYGEALDMVVQGLCVLGFKKKESTDVVASLPLGPWSSVANMLRAAIQALYAGVEPCVT